MDTEIFISFLKLLVALPVVVLLAYLSLRLGKVYMRSMHKGKNIRIIETVNINNRAFISIAKLGKEYFALGVSEEKINVLKKFDEEESAEILKNEQLSMQQTKQLKSVKEWIGNLRNGKKDSNESF